MTTDVTTTGKASVPALARDVSAESVLAWCMSGADTSWDGKLALANWPTDEYRAVLSGRHKQVAAALLHHDRKSMAAAISEMLDCYRNSLRKDEDARSVVVKYVKELVGVPTWAVEMACFQIRSGTAPGISSTYAPSTIEVRVLAEGIAMPFREEAVKIFRVLQATRLMPPVSETERGRVGKLLTDLAAAMRAGMSANREREIRPVLDRMRDTADEAIEKDYRARGKDVPRSKWTVSAALAAKIGEWKRTLSDRATEYAKEDHSR